MNYPSKLFAVIFLSLSAFFSSTAIGVETSCVPTKKTYQKCEGILLQNFYPDRTIDAIYIYPVGSPEGKNWLPWKAGLLPRSRGKIHPPASVVCPNPDSGPHLIGWRVTYKLAADGKKFEDDVQPSFDGCTLDDIWVRK